jgi:hypothetical protein
MTVMVSLMRMSVTLAGHVARSLLKPVMGSMMIVMIPLMKAQRDVAKVRVAMRASVSAHAGMVAQRKIASVRMTSACLGV